MQKCTPDRQLLCRQEILGLPARGDGDPVAILQAEANASDTIETSIRTDDCDADTVEDKLNDLISMMVIHLSGKYDTNLALAVLMALTSLKNDLTQNNRIRNRLLKPMFHVLINNH